MLTLICSAPAFVLWTDYIWKRQVVPMVLSQQNQMNHYRRGMHSVALSVAVRNGGEV